MHLIIQGINIENHDLRSLAKLSGADEIQRITGQAFRLLNANEKKDIASYCADVSLDYAFVDEAKRLTDFGLIAMDMDSTLLAIETIDEIADMHNIKSQVAAITRSTMRGEIGFAESLRRRTALLEGLHQDALQKVYDERLELSPGAEKLLKHAKAAGLKTMVISGGFTFFTDRIKTKLGLDYSAANTIEILNHRITGKVMGEIIDASGKAEVLKHVRDELGLQREQIITIGDGANDIGMMAESGISIAYHAKSIVQENAVYSINHVGLDGVVNLFG